MEDYIMIASTQLRKPENWQDFEKLCKRLWGEIWGCSDTIQRNGRLGQPQNGVDIYGLPKDETSYYGIQCKGKDDYTNSQLTKEEIDIEIGRALNFKPKLKRFIFATTANKDVKIEEYIREKNINSINQGKFEIYLSSWEDIVDLLEERRNTYNWYMNNCQYKNASDIEVYISGKKEHSIHPQYLRKIKSYKVKNNKLLYDDSSIKSLIPFDKDTLTHSALNFSKMIENKQVKGTFYRKYKVDYRWCTIPIKVQNIGDTVIEDVIIYLYFDQKFTAEIDDNFRYLNDRLMNATMIAQINAQMDSEREIFKSSEYNNVIEIRLKHPLVQTDHRIFEIKVRPKDLAHEIKVLWELKSRDFHKKGNLILKVEPTYENREEIIEVDNESELKETEEEIKPKIVEE